MGSWRRCADGQGKVDLTPAALQVSDRKALSRRAKTDGDTPPMVTVSMASARATGQDGGLAPTNRSRRAASPDFAAATPAEALNAVRHAC
jgi:hypothetical protein